MSVIGIDFGNESCYVAVARAGGIETIANDYSLRATPSCVAFSGKTRLVGVAAKNQMVTNIKSTICDFKRLLARNYNDPSIHPVLRDRPYRVEKLDGTSAIGIKVNYLDEEHVFTPQQIVAMLFTKLKDISESAIKTKVNDCVISVPSFFTNIERKALLDSAAIAGLNVLRLMNDTTATALAYGIYKQDLPAPEDRPRNVVFVDCGHSSLQVSACALHKGKLKMLSCASDPNIGGRNFDEVIANYFCSSFQSRYHIDPRNNSRAYLRLMTEVEKLKKQMSASSTKLPLNIECLVEDLDVHGEMKRDDMEQICSHLLERVEWTLRKCLGDCKLHPDEIYAVEIVGGSTRIPAIKRLIEAVFGHHPSATLNQDEAVARGCALQCAMMSPLVRVREFNITDVQNYGINMVWEDSTGSGELEVFPQNHPVPFSKMLTFYRKQPFAIRAYYNGSVPIPDASIGHVVVNGVKPSADGDCQKVKVKVRMNLNGMLSIGYATLIEKLEVEEGDETEPAVGDDGSVGTQSKEEEEPSGGEDKPEKKKNLVKVTELPIDSYWNDYTQRPVSELRELECEMIASDRQEKLRVDARNALEEYVYELRGKLSAEDQLAPFVSVPDRDSLCRQLDDMEQWLYEEGEQCPRQMYADKLASLRTLGDPIETRRAEFAACEGAVLELSGALQATEGAMDLHLQQDDMQTVLHALERQLAWLDKQRAVLAETLRTQDPPISAEQIRQEKQAFLNSVNPILAKHKPQRTEGPQVNTASEVKEGQGDQTREERPEQKMEED